MTDPIREAVAALDRAGLIHSFDSEEAINIIRAELREAVPARILTGPIGLQDEAYGWNACLKELGL